MGDIWKADGILIKQIINEEIYSMRPQGIPRWKWTDSVQETIMVSQKRKKWKDLVSEAKIMNVL